VVEGDEGGVGGGREGEWMEGEEGTGGGGIKYAEEVGGGEVERRCC